MSTPLDLGIPSSTSTITVRAIDVSPGAIIPAAYFTAPVLPGREFMTVPCYAFVIEHASKDKRVMFDLGPRKDTENYAPAILELLKPANGFKFEIEKDVTEVLVEGGISLESIQTVIWSHTHLDHTGDMSKFPPSTELLAGPGFTRKSYPTHADATLLDSDFAGRKVTELSFEGATLSIGGYAAIDYFEDGSFYLLNTPGHCPGHITALARVTTTSFVLLGGDTCHHPGQLRPIAEHHTNFPCPGALLAATRKSISVADFGTPSQAGSSQEDGFDLTSRKEPLLALPSGPSAYEDRETSIVSQAKLAKLDASPDVFVVLAHDGSLDGILELFPESLNGWKEKGWKERSVWAFIEEGNRAFRFNAAQ